MVQTIAQHPASGEGAKPTDKPVWLRSRKRRAGSSLAAMGEYGRAAMLAADQDERVRTGVACVLLSRVE